MAEFLANIEYNAVVRASRRHAEKGQSLRAMFDGVNPDFARKFSEADERRFQSCLLAGMIAMAQEYETRECQDQTTTEGENDGNHAKSETRSL